MVNGEHIVQHGSVLSFQYLSTGGVGHGNSVVVRVLRMTPGDEDSRGVDRS